MSLKLSENNSGTLAPSYEDPLRSVPLDKAAQIEAMKYDLNIFSATVLPEFHIEDFPELHCNIWQECLASVNGIEKLAQFAIGLPRGHAKTQLMKFLLLYCILFTDRTFMMVVCNAATLAQSILEDVMDMLQSENIVALFGSLVLGQKDKDNADLKKFRFLGKNIILKPMGAGSSTRGTNINNRRPEIILCDDMQSSEEAASPEVSDKLLTWFRGTLFKARSYARCTIIYVGNMYPDLEIGERGSNVYSCILRNLQLSPSWRSWIVGAILEDGTALWENVISLETLLEELAQDLAMGKEEIFYAEVLNDPKATNTRFIKLDKVKGPNYTDYDMPVGKYLIIDPSLGKKRSDDQMVGLFYVYDEKGPVLMEVRNFQCSAPDLVKGVLQWALEEGVPLIASEAVAYQATLLQWFVFFFDALGIEGINCVGVTPKGMSKPSRILLFFKAWMSGLVRVHDKAKPVVSNQATAYVPTSRNNTDDALDVAAYGETVFLEYSTEWMLDLNAVFHTVTSTSEAPTEQPVNDLAEFIRH